MDFDSVADELYSGPRDAFIATRAERAAEAKQAGDGDLAKKIKELRKPSIAAWLVNRLAREHADDLSDLAALGEELRGAHADLDGDRLRELSTRKRIAVEQLAEKIKAFGPEPTAAIMDQVSGTLEAAAASADTAADVAAGRLDAAVPPSGFEQWLIAPVGSTPRAAPRKPAASRAGTPDDAPRDRRRQQKLDAAREQLAAAETTRAETEDVLATADDAAAQAARNAADLQSRLAAAERELRKRRDAAGQARRAYDAAVRAADAAEKAVQRIELQ